MLLTQSQQLDKSTITPKIDFYYTDLQFVSQAATYKVYIAKLRNSQQFHTIRAFDTASEFVRGNFSLAATLFIQELLRLYSLHPELVFIHTFEISDEMKMAYATLTYSSLEDETNKKSIDPKDPKFLQKLIKDVTLDVEFMWKILKWRKILDTLGPEDIYFTKEKDAYFVGNWTKVIEKSTSAQDDQSVVTYPSATIQSITSQDIPEEINALGLIVLKINKIDCEEIQTLRAIKNLNSRTYDAAIRETLAEAFNNSELLKNLMPRMLSKDLQKLPSLEELRGNIKDAKVQPEEEKKLQINGKIYFY